MSNPIINDDPEIGNRIRKIVSIITRHYELKIQNTRGVKLIMLRIKRRAAIMRAVWRVIHKANEKDRGYRHVKILR
jgi:hypothetical protein